MIEPHPIIERTVRMALAEDLGPGDVTTQAVLDHHPRGTASLLAREPLVLAGMAVFEATFTMVCPDIRVQSDFSDGELISPGQAISTVDGPLDAILKGERTALNFIQRMSGIATLTRQYVERVQDTRAKILDTRKTAPGLRWLDKYAVRTGGGHNHRFGLFDGVLIKDNHIASAGSITKAVHNARNQIPHTLKIEIEVEDLAGVKEACRAGADIILLDNMSPPLLTEAVGLINGAALVEASGGITLESVAAVARSGVDMISVGELTHSAKASDFTLKIDPRPT
ncbi:MAG: carboxylating nicotinate-nucleotide diphosphorylase [Desulfatiglandaceae bacterium]